MTNETATDTELTIFTRYADGEITAEHAADLLGPGVAVADVVIGTANRLHRLPDARNAFTEAELRRGLVMLGLTPAHDSGEVRS